MNGTFPLQRDPVAASPPSDEAGLQREIAEARQGVRSKISTKAAAYYLAIHPKTLLDWVKGGTGPDTVKNPSRPGTTALNQRLGFTLAALDAFIASRTGDAITRGSRSDAEAVRRESDRIQAAIDLKAAEDQLAKARARAQRLGVVCFQTLADATEVQPWARIEGRIAGHAWAVDDATFDAAGDDIVEATLEEVLSLPWNHEAGRRPYADAMLAVLASARTVVDDGRVRQIAADLGGELPSPLPDAPVCRRCGEPTHPGAPCRL